MTDSKKSPKADLELHTVEPVQTIGEAPGAGREAQHARKSGRAGPCAPKQHMVSTVTSQLRPQLSEGQKQPASDGFLKTVNFPSGFPI